MPGPARLAATSVAGGDDSPRVGWTAQHANEGATMRTIGTLALCAAMAAIISCGSKTGGGDDGTGDDDDSPQPEPEWTIDVDMSGLDRFVPAGTATWPVAGRATASEGLAGVEVAESAATVG